MTFLILAGVMGASLALFMNGRRFLGGAAVLASALLILLNILAEAKKAGFV